MGIIMKNPERTVIHRGHWNNHLVEIIDYGGERTLYFAGNVLQSSMSLSSPEKLVLSYTRYMMASLLIDDAPERVLVIGVGAGSLLRFIRHYLPECRIDGIDNSQTIIDLARGYFKLPADSNVSIHCRDGYEFLKSLPEKQKYSLIMIDAFDAKGMSSSIYRTECFSLCRDHLRSDGVLSLNLWSGNKTRMESVITEVDSYFDSVIELPVPNRGNVICLAGDSNTLDRMTSRHRDELDRLSKRFGINFRPIVKLCLKHNIGFRQRFGRIFS